MKRQITFLLIAFYLVSIIGSVPSYSVRAATLVVTNTNDSGTGSLRQAMIDATGGDTITFDSSLSGQTIRLQSTLTIDKNITIDASALSEKIILSGDSDNDSDGDILILNILANQVVSIKNVEFTKGYRSSGLVAGAIENLGDLSVYNSEFNFNIGNQGGAIRNSGGLYVEDSTFTNNTAQEGGAILNNLNAEAEIRNSAFSDNSSSGQYATAGAIGNIGIISIYDSQFTNNSAPLGGGAFVNAINGTATISNSTFTGNSTPGDGGAVYNSEGIVNITQSTFTNNSANYGAAIMAGDHPNGPDTTTTISESLISNNQATGGGGGIEFDSGTSMTIDKTTISGNTAPAGGGIVNVSGNLLTITNSTISNNTATQSPQPGGIISLFSPVTIKNSTITGNNHTAVGIQGIAIISNTTIAGNSGYGLEVFTYSLSITNSILANNTNTDCRIQNGATVITNQSNLIESNSGCGTPASTADPLLGALADNGGLTQTMTLLSGSPAIDAGNNATCESTDQRGVSRPQGASCDIGAYEYKTPVTLSAPKIPRTMFRLLTNNATPSLSWLQVNEAFEYEITLASDKSFTNIVLNETLSTELFTPSTPLADGIYYWKVRALNEISQAGKFSIVQTLTIDTTPPAIPTLTSPMHEAELKRSPILRWTRVTGVVVYILEIANSENFEDATIYTLRTNSRNLPALPDGVYYWRVQTKDAAGNWSGWSVIRTFTMQ